MATVQEIDPTETPLDPDVTEMQPPLSGTVDDDDDVDDERWDENEAPERQLSDTTEARDEFRLDEREEEPGLDAGADENALSDDEDAAESE
jgi:hypothetical protein